jgi:hypothetical protein
MAEKRELRLIFIFNLPNIMLKRQKLGIMIAKPLREK